MTVATLSPVETDTQLAALYRERQSLAAQIARTELSVLGYAGAKQEYRGRRRVYTMGMDEAYSIVRECLATGAEFPGGFYIRPEQVQATLDRIEELEVQLAEATNAAAHLQATYTGWSRYFLVTSSDGHIHSSMRCSTCYPTTAYGWLPELSGQSEAEAVAALGSTLCSVCFPSAPTEWQDGSFTAAEAERIAAGGLQAAQEIRAAKAARNADVCPGSGQVYDQSKPHRSGYYSGNYGYCSHCGAQVTLSSRYATTVRKHKAAR